MKQPNCIFALHNKDGASFNSEHSVAFVILSKSVVTLYLKVIGSITAVKLIIMNLPEIGHGPRLNVDIHRGALTEGLLTLAIVSISLGLSKSSSNSFFLKTWMSSVSKIALHILGSDLTGGCMNPASAMGWAYARGEHMTKDHLYVYWLAPIEATLLAVWTFRLLLNPQKQEEKPSLIECILISYSSICPKPSVNIVLDFVFGYLPSLHVEGSLIAQLCIISCCRFAYFH
ncbi:hypothetical protein IFM89_016431 [Coptis chinensis]|uniref:Aquaporin SIP2-1 n=1 Tax=Coptis chinensis TaxID=261450 RepID=A0A835HBI1_9MAGN|nr:hypothetical protein IFM89_016431 [Coptis chinensis]